MVHHIATLPRHREADRARRGRNLRRAGVAVLCVLVAAGLTGALGPRAGTVRADGGGYELSIRYGQVTRPSIPVPLEITVRRDGGFAGPVTLSISSDLLDRIDFNDWYPNPDAETAGPTVVEYEFAPPSGEVLHVLLDARTAPGQLPSTQRYAVAVVEQDTEVARATFRMTVLP
ncbi:hypothetical protein [Jiangella asiatica]|uniref:Uncharacterized protein n=1 Tax=Jiangella asiatica TaxID=2530372 RepID=A0A4R5DWV1_9ACTN|nr:hypothetical protein [Jiangella asiatica]TDE15785.1 hypothetical protein E1269_00300 [Jiangella asiatica]